MGKSGQRLKIWEKFPVIAVGKKGRGEARQKGGKNYRALIYEKNFLVSKLLDQRYIYIVRGSYERIMTMI